MEAEIYFSEYAEQDAIALGEHIRKGEVSATKVKAAARNAIGEKNPCRRILSSNWSKFIVVDLNNNAIDSRIKHGDHMTILLVTISLFIVLTVVVIGVHLWNHFNLRRSVLFDRQDLFHSLKAFHIVSALKLKPGQKLLEGVGRYVKGVERQGTDTSAYLITDGQDHH